MGELFASYNILGAFGLTILLAVFSAIGSLLIGTVVAIMRVSPIDFLNKVGAFYVNIVRNTPLTLIIVFCNIGFIVNLGMSFTNDIARNNIIWAIIGLSFYHAAFVCEALRSGVNTVPVGQARLRITLTAAHRVEDVDALLAALAEIRAITPLGNTLIALTKNTTVATAIGVAEISGLMKEMMEFRPDLIFVIFFLVALGFVMLTLPVGILTTRLSTKLAVKR